MFSTPLICSSIGATTVEATTSALAPGYWPDTLMTGGAISGYCATGRRVKATAPRITITTETTAAKIGLSMKKCEIRMRPRLDYLFEHGLIRKTGFHFSGSCSVLGLRAGRRLGALLLRRDLLAWP